MAENKQQDGGKSGIGVQPDVGTAASSGGGQDLRDPSGEGSTTGKAQPSALGGHVATRSGTADGTDTGEEADGD